MDHQRGRDGKLEETESAEGFALLNKCTRHGAKRKLCAAKDVQIKSSNKDSAISMGQSANYVAAMDAQIYL